MDRTYSSVKHDDGGAAQCGNIQHSGGDGVPYVCVCVCVGMRAEKFIYCVLDGFSVGVFRKESGASKWEFNSTQGKENNNNGN